MIPAKPLLYMIVLMMVMYVVFALILWPVWNYTIPKIVDSVNPEFYGQGNEFENITFPTALVFSLLIGLVFGHTYVSSGAGYLAYYAEKYPERKRKTDSAYDTVFSES